MTIKISDDLNIIINFAREEAMRTGSYGIAPDHLMLGIIRHGSNCACEVLKSLEIDLQQLKQHIDSRVFTNEHIPYSDIEKVAFSRKAHNTLSITILEATQLGQDTARPEHLLLALSKCHGYCQEFLNASGVDYGTIFNNLKVSGLLFQKEEADNEGIKEQDVPEADTRKESSALKEFGFDLTKAAAEGKLDPVVGRETEITRVIQILGRRKKNNPMLVGDPGTGKSAIAEGIALRIASGQTPPALKNKKLISLDIASVVAGTRYRGDFEKRIKSIISEMQADPDVILFIDEFHTIVGAGGASGSLDAAGLLKPALARGEIQCIGATTLDEFRKTVEKDAALDRRFQKVLVEPSDIAFSIDILKAIKPNYEMHHNVHYTDEAIEACVKLSERYISDRCLPDKAIDAMDEAGSKVRLRKSLKPSASDTVSASDIADVISEITGIPAARVAQGESLRLMKMEKVLKEKVIGQDKAVELTVGTIKRARALIQNPSKPLGSFLFMGPTGVGKTLLAKALAEYLFDSEDNLIRIDMSEYMEKFNVSRLVGAPPGYVGYDQGGQLSEQVRRKPYCVVLLDEIEKAHPDIFNILLQILDEGRLTDSTGHVVNFRNTIVIMTSNVGSREIQEFGNGMGFSTSGRDESKDRNNIIEKAVRKVFPPEFINRIDEQVYFNSLGRDDISRIIDIELTELKKRVAETGFKLSVSASVKAFVAGKGYNPNFGARPLKRAVRRWIEDPVSEFIIADRMASKASKVTSSEPRNLKVKLTSDRQGTCIEPC